jgi:hypothetical protein
MKKLFLTSIVALLLATGTAQAQYVSPDGSIDWNRMYQDERQRNFEIESRRRQDEMENRMRWDQLQQEQRMRDIENQQQRRPNDECIGTFSYRCGR